MERYPLREATDQEQLKEQEREIVQREMDLVLQRNDTPLPHEEVKARLMEKIRAS